MAKSVTYNKRENEKKKQARRAEKQKKKEDRKLLGKANSFDDMIAYVDENGVITSTPPELNPNKEEIKQEDILISTPKKEDIETPTVLKGRVDYFNESKGYGFIKDLGSDEKYFFHVSNNTLTDISETDIVTFELERGLRGMNAINIRIESAIVHDIGIHKAEEKYGRNPGKHFSSHDFIVQETHDIACDAGCYQRAFSDSFDPLSEDQ